MGIDITALTTNADKLDECIDKNEKQERDRKDEQLHCIIEKKVRKEEHKREKPRGQDGALKKCKRLFEEGASSEVLTKLEESLREQEKYYRYYVQCFLPVLDEAIERSKKTPNETKERVKQVISEITYNSKYCFTHNRRDSETESGYGSDVEDDHKVEISNEITNSNALLLKAIKNGNNRKFKKYLKDCTDINSVKGEKDNNILHLIVSLEKKQKCKFLGTLIKTVTEEDLAQLINSENQEEQTPLHQLLQHIKEKNDDRSCTDRKFEKTNRYKALELFLQNGADITVQDKDGKNALHYIASFKGEQKVTCLELISNKDDAVNTTNREGLTPLHQLLQHIKGKNEDRSCTDRKFEKTKRYETLELLLKNGADITVQDKDEKNALHYIASFKGEQKVTCLELILGLVKNGTISSEKLHKAINAQNEDDKYPAQVALIRQTEKIPSKLKDFSRWVRSRPTKHYYTAEFCAELLQNGAENKSDHITIPKEHRKQKYYQTTKRIKDITGVSPDPETQEELEEHFSKKNGRKDISLPVKWILGGLIFATVFSALAGNMIAAAALSVTIAVCAMCYPVYLKLENALNARAQKPSDQSEHTENPATKMSDVSILRQSINKLVGNVL